MRKPVVFAAVVLCGVGLLAVTNLLAQRSTGPAAPRGAVAVVDVAGVSTKCDRLKQALDGLKADYESHAATLKKESEAGNLLAEKINKMPVGSPERKKLEQEVMKKRADFE